MQLPELTAALLDQGYPEDDVRAILGGNFLRVASHVWR
jgi:membrane dipeptidase